jgi:hypothetical protein
MPLIAGIRVYPSQLRTAGIEDEENTQRCRSALFLGIGGVVAAVTGAARVEVFESGVGAVNLPLMAGMVGSKATKGSHPKLLRLMSRLLSLVVGREVEFILPFLDRTKAEVVVTLAEEGLDELARSSVSCVHYPLRERPHKQCGVCPACVFRRQAIAVAGIEEPTSCYKYDLFGMAQAVSGVPSEEMRFLRAFLMQSAKLAELDDPTGMPRFFRGHLLGTGVAENGESLAPFVELFRRYRQEWLGLVAKGRERGWPWARLLTPERVAV